MALSDIIRKGIATANNITSSLQIEVTHEPWIGYNEEGTELFGVPTLRKALVEQSHNFNRSLASSGGVAGALTKSTDSPTKLTFIGPIDPNGAEGRQEPFDPRDRLTLFDGKTGVILNVNGLNDPKTGEPYMWEVSLGG